MTEYQVREYLKAIVAALIALTTAVGAHAADGIDTIEWVYIIGETLVAFGAVFGVPNLPRKDTNEPSTN